MPLRKNPHSTAAFTNRSPKYAAKSLVKADNAPARTGDNANSGFKGPRIPDMVIAATKRDKAERPIYLPMSKSWIMPTANAVIKVTGHEHVHPTAQTNPNVKSGLPNPPRYTYFTLRVKRARRMDIKTRAMSLLVTLSSPALLLGVQNQLQV